MIQNYKGGKNAGLFRERMEREKMEKKFRIRNEMKKG